MTQAAHGETRTYTNDVDLSQSDLAKINRAELPPIAAWSHICSVDCAFELPAEVEDWSSILSGPAPGRKYQRPCRQPQLPVIAGSEPSAHVVSLSKYGDDTRDWRKLPWQDISQAYTLLSSLAAMPKESVNKTRLRPSQAFVDASKLREGLIVAVAVGILQALQEGVYWTRSFVDANAVERQHIRMPISRLFPAEAALPKLGEGLPSAPPQVFMSSDGLGPLDSCLEELQEVEKKGRLEPRPHVALVHFVPAGDPTGLQPGFGDFREAPLLYRSTYLRALQEMPRHLHSDLVCALEVGSLVYTADVSIVRGTLEAGAPWLAEASRLDVITVALQRRPRQDPDDMKGSYVQAEDKASIAKTLGFVFRCAAAHGVEALVLPAPGSGGAQQCHHPAADAGDAVRSALAEHGRGIARVRVCSDDGSPASTTWWAAFAQALRRGRGPPPRPTNLREGLVLSSMNLPGNWDDARGGARSKGWVKRLQLFPPPGRARPQRLLDGITAGAAKKASGDESQP